jgi:hypothetical protein
LAVRNSPVGLARLKLTGKIMAVGSSENNSTERAATLESLAQITRAVLGAAIVPEVGQEPGARAS